MGAKYRYALNNAGAVVDIFEIDPARRDVGAPYTCVGCAKPVVTVFPTEKTKHFRHKHEEKCSNESYLHKLGKQVFAETYRKALAEGEPFYILQDVDGVCTHFRERYGFGCKLEVEDEYDLTHRFTRLDIEAPIGEFRADVLLSTASGREVILVEIAVSHKCEQAKIDFGKRIIEINVDNEADIRELMNPVVIIGRNAIVHNFKEYMVEDDFCKGKCSRKVYVFVLSHQWKTAIVDEPMHQAVDKLDNPNYAKHVEIVGYDYISRLEVIKVYRRKVREFYFKGAPIRNCYLCKYHGASRSKAVYCKKDGEDYASEQAIQCNVYQPLSSMRACDAVDKVNDEYRARWRGYRY